MEYKKSVPQNFNTMANEFTVLVKSAIIKSITGMLVGDVLSKPYLLSFILHAKLKISVHMSSFLVPLFDSVIFLFVNVFSVMNIAELLPT